MKFSSKVFIGLIGFCMFLAVAHAEFIAADIGKWFQSSGNTVTRGDFIKAVVEMNGGILNSSGNNAGFADLDKSSPYYPYFMEAAHERWFLGTGDCLGQATCMAAPNETLKLRDFAITTVRAFALQATGKAPSFSDNPWGAWGSSDITTVQRTFEPMIAFH